MRQLSYVKLLIDNLGVRSGVLNLWGVRGRVPGTLKGRYMERRKGIPKYEREKKKGAYLFSLTSN